MIRRRLKRKHSIFFLSAIAVLLGVIINSLPLFGNTSQATLQFQTKDNYFGVTILGGLSSLDENYTLAEALTIYCETMQTASTSAGYLDQGLYYNPKHSLFVQALCKDILESTIFIHSDNLKDHSRDSILGNIPQGCDPRGTMNTCRIGTLVPALFTKVMNEHATMSIAGWTFANDTDKAIEEFSKTYFGDLAEICQDNKQFVGNQSPANQKSALCSHPLTYEYIKTIMQDLIKQKKNLTIINGDTFSGFDQGLCAGDQLYNNLFLCGYSYTSSTSTLGYQYNLWYNELLHYQILLTRLTSSVLNNPRLNATISQNPASISFGKDITDLQREEILSIEALEQMQKSINNIRSTFPIHIGLQIYYEDLIRFRDSLARIYTPIHQLNYTLRNVQSK